MAYRVHGHSVIRTSHRIHRLRRTSRPSETRCTRAWVFGTARPPFLSQPAPPKLGFREMTKNYTFSAACKAYLNGAPSALGITYCGHKYVSTYGRISTLFALQYYEFVFSFSLSSSVSFLEHNTRKIHY